MADGDRTVALKMLPGFVTILWLALFFTGRCWPCNSDYDYVRKAEIENGNNTEG